MASNQRPALVIDVGSATTKLGFSSNSLPSYTLPTASLGASPAWGSSVGHARARTDSSSSGSVVQAWGSSAREWGCVDEAFWHEAFFTHLRVDPEDHTIVLAEPAHSVPESREAIVERCTERRYTVTTGVAGGTGVDLTRLTGLVVDSGEGGTQVVPVLEGCVVQSGVRPTPVGGAALTAYVEGAMRARGDAGLPPSGSAGCVDAARRTKEACCYVCAEVEAELSKYDGPNGASMFKAHILGGGAAAAAGATGATAVLSVRTERFLAPELLFTPSLSSATSLATPLPTLIDEAVQACPIDFRRALHGNVMLAGGTMGLRNLRTRLQYAVQTKHTQHIGTFASKEIAARAYDCAAVQVHGPGAKRNFPGEAISEPPVSKGDERKQRKSSRYPGVSWHKSGLLWHVKLKDLQSKRQQHIGYYASEEDAARAYDFTVVQAHGPGAKRNFPGEDNNKPPATVRQQRKTSRYLGVSLSKNGSSWYVSLQDLQTKRMRHIGSFAPEEDAARAYDYAAVQARGPGAKRNFPGEAISELP
ncbi:hypothetical protein FOA52_014033 [Chlamydomonas sp. UWO 241]|nr:hypothetical protein FOA52_014033 [Chlamydomonas sp. UWO 241]